MKVKAVLLHLFCLIFFACGDDTNTSVVEETKVKNQEVKITAKAIDNFDFVDYALSTNADAIIANWEKYQELGIQISYLRKADLSFFNGEKLVLKKFIDEFRATIPSELRTNPIVSRTVIIETALLKLNENLRIDNIDVRIKLVSVKDVLESFSNLNYQINKKLERDIYDKIEKE